MAIGPPEKDINNLLKHYQNGNYEIAEGLVLSIIEKYPKHQFAWKAFAAILKKTGRLSESLVASRKSLELSPQDAEAHYNLSNTLKELDRVAYLRFASVYRDFQETDDFRKFIDKNLNLKNE